MGASFLSRSGKKYSSNIPTPREAAGFVPFEKVCEVRDRLSKFSLDKLLLSLYTLCPPSRNDFNCVRLVHRSTPPTVGKIKTPNYLWIPHNPKKDGLLVLREHKSSKSYSVLAPLQKTIPAALCKLIQNTLVYSPREFLFVNQNGVPFTPAAFSTWACRRLRHLFADCAVNPTLTMLRHSAITYYLSQAQLTQGQREWLAEQSGHSCELQAQYYWRPDQVDAIRAQAGLKPAGVGGAQKTLGGKKTAPKLKACSKPVQSQQVKENHSAPVNIILVGN